MHIIVSYDQNISKIIFVKMDSMSGCDIRLVFSFPPKDSTQQYKKCVHLWNNFPCIITLDQIHDHLTVGPKSKVVFLFLKINHLPTPMCV